MSALRIVRAEAMGMCFGVREALRALDAIPEPREVTVFGELVHNEVVTARLGARGFASCGESERRELPSTPVVLVTAHGISDRERDRLAAAGKRVLDTTCPLVRRAHEAAKRLAADGRHVVVVGRPGHVEVEGLTGDLPASTVVPGPEAAREIPATRIGIVFQTTTTADHAAETVRAVRAANPAADLRVVDTVCRPTRERQEALVRLLGEVDLLVVVGGSASNNTRALLDRARDRGVPAHRVADASEVRAGWLEGVRTVGLTAGTSTLPETIDEVERALLRARPVLPLTPAALSGI